MNLRSCYTLRSSLQSFEILLAFRFIIGDIPNNCGPLNISRIIEKVFVDKKLQLYYQSLYYVHPTGSLLKSEVKPRGAQIVLGWVTEQ